MKVPADLFARSPRVCRGLEELTYPFHDQAIMVTGCGRICFRGRKVNLSYVFAGQRVGVTQVGEAPGSSPSCSTIWGISTMRRVG
jgi:putative transposase